MKTRLFLAVSPAKRPFDSWETGMKAGEKKIFIKSGNEVRLVERSGQGDWVVERTRGASKGKRMICPERALVGSPDA
ncbi:hypothetical protein [Marinobacter halodurans]|uniref:hypothetical protein n=1 Tax=Marinobacter halodurans TaxID=2528979 RepID=UPI001A955DFD|nr:hypothetical protein [Marinobacter halodurans]